MAATSSERVCWKCGASLADLTLPLRRLEECRRCAAELHVCRMCADYDPRVAKSCREPMAEEVQEKERANFCDYFAPRPGAYTAPDTGPAERARAELDALFGGGPGSGAPTGADTAREGLEALFDKKKK